MFLLAKNKNHNSSYMTSLSNKQMESVLFSLTCSSKVVQVQYLEKSMGKSSSNRIMDFGFSLVINVSQPSLFNHPSLAITLQWDEIK